MDSVASLVSLVQPTNLAPLPALLAYTQSLGLERFLARPKRGYSTLVLSVVWLVLAWRGSGRPEHLGAARATIWWWPSWRVAGGPGWGSGWGAWSRTAALPVGRPCGAWPPRGCPSFWASLARPPSAPGWPASVGNSTAGGAMAARFAWA